jgi:hypothetical protein
LQAHIHFNIIPGYHRCVLNPQESQDGARKPFQLSNYKKSTGVASNTILNIPSFLSSYLFRSHLYSQNIANSQSHSRPRNNPRQHGIALSGPTILVSARRGAADPTIDDDDLLEMKNRRRMAPRASSLSSSKLGGKNIQVDTDADLITKLKLAWRIFFPDKPKSLSPKEEGKKRLRMILVADRYVVLHYTASFFLFSLISPTHAISHL